MAQKTYEQIEQEANRLFGNKPSTKKFDWRRAQQREAGLETEAKKRGGYAGVYDRNKKLVAGIGTGIGYLVGGPMGAAAVRGGIQGLDRPGKAGIGFDIKRGVKGALEGYGAGQVAALGQAGIGKLMARGAGSIPALPANAPMIDTPMPNIGGAGASGLKPMPQMGRGITDIGQRIAGQITPPGVGTDVAAQGGRSLLGRVGSYISKKPEVLGQAFTAYSRDRREGEKNKIAREQLAQAESQFQRTFGQSEEERKREIERQQRIAQLLAPLFAQLSGRQG